MHQQRGFTIIELMVTLVVFAILVGIAAPNLSEFLLTQRVSGQASELINSLALARSEAGKRNASIVVIPQTNSVVGWSDGWCVGPTTIANCGDANVIKQYQPSGTDVSIASNYLQAGNRLTFRRDGTLLTPGSASTFKVTSAQLSDDGNNARCVGLNGLGKASMTKVSRDANC